MFPSTIHSNRSTDPVLDAAPTARGRTAEFARSLNSFFIENWGQVGSGIRYYARGNPAVAFRDDGVMYVLGRESRRPMGFDEPMESAMSRNAAPGSVAYMLRFDGARPVVPIGRGILPFNVNFFLGNDPAGWRTHVPVFSAVAYEDIYDGIDLIYRQSPDGIKYELRIDQGADPSIIEMRYEGVESSGLDAEGIVVSTALGNVRDANPYSYQEPGGNVDCSFVSRGAMSYGFDCGDYDRSRTLVIDPLVYSTYLTGSLSDAAYSVTVSDMNRAYVTGYTQSGDFPATPGAFDTDLDLDPFGYGYDAFVAEFNELGTLPFFITFLGGHDIDAGYGIALDPLRNVYVTGSTSSLDFPTTPTAFSKVNFGFTDAFVTKLDASGALLNYSTYIGGGNIDSGSSIAVDAFGNATVTGYTMSTNFPITASSWDKILNGTRDAFVTRVFWSGEWLVYSTYLGGVGIDIGNSVSIDQAGNAYVTGQTYSADFPTTTNGTDLILNGTSDAFVTKLNKLGSILYFSTFLGGDSGDAGYSITVDQLGGAYITGATSSPDFNVTNASYDVSYNGGYSDAFVTKFNMTAGTLNYSTFLGGPQSDEGRGIAVDGYGVAYVTGSTNSSGFPTTRWAYDDHGCSGTWDAYVTKLKSTGDGLVYSSYLSSCDTERAYSIAVDPQNGFYVVGEVNNASFPTTPGAFSTVFGGRWDGFLTKFPSLSVGDPPDLRITPGYISFSPSNNVPIGTMVGIYAFVHNIGGTNATLVRVRFHDGTPSPTNQIGSDYIIPIIEYFDGSDAANIDWEALVLGFHSICVVVDPEGEIGEINEDNNQACANIRVYLPPSPDLVLTAANISFLPPAPVIEGTNVTIQATIWNAGGAASGQTVARFLDGGPTSARIGSDQFVDVIASGGEASVSVVWNTSRVGNHVICAYADPDNAIVEANENNNVDCVDYEVLAPGVFRPDYTPVQPQPPSPVRIALSSPLSLSIRVFNAGNATPASNATVAFYNELIPNFPFASFELPPLSASNMSLRFTANWTSPATPGTHRLVADVEYRNNITEWNESNNLFVWTVDVVTGPVTSLIVGSPNYTVPSAITYVRSSTPLDFWVVDQSGAGILNTTYRVDGGDWVNYTETGSFNLAGEGYHSIDWYSIDRAGNLEVTASMTLVVDDAPPATAIVIGQPMYLTGGVFIKSTAPITYSAADAGVGSNATFYRAWATSWSPWSEFPPSGIQFLVGDGTWYVEFLSYDYIGNVESVQNQTIVVDDTPPVTTISSDATLTLDATDSGCGVNVTMYRIDGGGWTVYVGGFTLTEGEHTIYYYSIDFLGNVEQERSFVVKPAAEAAVNYKPIVAVVFAIILLVAGVWSSKRRPWKGGKGRMAVAKAFTVISMPFALLEAATGMISLATGYLSIPPAVGPGTGVDIVIIVAGLSVAFFMGTRSLQPESNAHKEDKS